MGALTYSDRMSLGSLARAVRENLVITSQELGDLAGVSSEAVEAFENNQPVPLDARRKILKELWTLKKTREK
jgi:DNA-binding XRE family transcriptional regulator